MLSTPHFAHAWPSSWSSTSTTSLGYLFIDDTKTQSDISLNWSSQYNQGAQQSFTVTVQPNSITDVEVKCNAVSGILHTEATPYNLGFKDSSVLLSSSSSSSWTKIGSIVSTGLKTITINMYYESFLSGNTLTKGHLRLTSRQYVTSPSAPTGVSASDGTYSDRICVSWDSVSGATSYTVYRSESTTGTKTNVGDTSSTSFDDTSSDLVAGTTYHYWVKASNSAGTSGFSSSDTGWKKSASSGNAKYALCVGINTYTLSGCGNLSGCVNDASYFYNNLVNCGGWSGPNMTRLTNSGATKSAIRKAIQTYAAAASSGDTFIYQHSSHGGSATDSSGNYTKDVCLCAYDEEYWDYELASDLAGFKSGVKVVVIADTCHSGGLFKGQGKNADKGISFDIASRVSALIDAQREKEAKSGTKAATKGISSSEIGWATAAEYDKTSADGGCYDGTAWMDDFWNYNYSSPHGGYGCGGAFMAALTWGWWTGKADSTSSSAGNGSGTTDVYEGFSYAKSVLENIGLNSPVCLNSSVLRNVVLGTNGGFPTSPSISVGDWTGSGNSSAITVNWSGAKNATSYKVYRATTPYARSSSSPIASELTSSSYTDSSSDLSPGTRYYYWVEAVNSSGSAFSGADYGYTGDSVVSLSTALDNTALSFTSGGGAEWWGLTGGVSHDGADAAHSGKIGDSQDSWLQTTVSGPGKLSFWWKVSCEAGTSSYWYDCLEIVVDEVVKKRIEGQQDWTQFSLDISESGTHTVKWNYHKDSSGLSGSDCGWLDQVTWTPSLPAVQTVHFDANGGSCSISELEYTIGGTYASPALPTSAQTTRTGHSFAGWWTASTGGTRITASSTVSSSATRTLYAHWTCNHSSTSLQNARAATCTVAGYTGDQVCADCGAVVSTGTAIPALGHQEGAGVVTQEPTAMAEGVMTYSCARCGAVLRTEPIPLLEIDRPDLRFATFDDWDFGYAMFTVADGAAESVFSSAPIRLIDCNVPFRIVYGYVNTGDAAISDETVTTRFEMVAESGETAAVSESSQTLSLEPFWGSQTATLNPTWATLPAGVYTACVTLDADSVLTDTNRANNVSEFVFAIRDPLPLAEALGSDNLAFETSGDDWYGTRDGADSSLSYVRTKHLGNYGTNLLQATTSRAGTLSFDWKVSSEQEYDWLEFLVDGVVTNRISGTDCVWQSVSLSLPDGDHELQWRYRKDHSYYSGLDCAWLANVVWTPVPLKFEISFGANGGTGTMPPQTFTEDVAQMLSTNAFARADWHFLGWSEDPSATVPTWTDGQSITATSDMTLFAVWEEDPPTAFITNLRARQRYPWNGFVDISFTLEGEAWAYDFSIAATNAATGEALSTATVYPRGGKPGDELFAEPGEVHLVWDAGTDVPESVISNVALYVTVSDGTVEPLYLVIDLSGGANAMSYPVTKLMEAPAGGFNTDEYKTTKLVLRRIPAGSFQMGCEDNEIGFVGTEAVPHEVTISKPFYLGIFEMTQRQYELVTGAPQYLMEISNFFTNTLCYQTRPMEMSGYGARGTMDPTEQVSEETFLGKLTKKTAKISFDLPTEAEWEYACRAGTTSALNVGINLTSNNKDNTMSQVGRYLYNGGGQSHGQNCSTNYGTAAVGSYIPNAWGLYDMHGNMWEYTRDIYRGRKSFGSTPVIDPIGVYSDVEFDGMNVYMYDYVCRGGGNANNAASCRSASRSSGPSDFLSGTGGVRISCSAESTEKKRRVFQTTFFSLDTRTGIRRAAEVETLQYDVAWYGGDRDTVLWASGDAMTPSFLNASTSGQWLWDTSETPAGLRTLTLVVYGEESEFGVTKETAQFAVNANYLDIAPEGDGTVNVESGWFAQTATAVVRATAAEHWSFVGWEGDTSGARISGPTIRAPMTTDRSIRAVFARNQKNLTVSWAHGAEASPANGVHVVGEGLEVSASVPEVVFLADGVKAECLGWTGTGSAPEPGTGTNVTFTVLADSSISWLWRTNYLVRVSVVGDGAVDVSEAWVAAGDTLAVTATPGSTALASAQWTGDMDGATVDAFRISLPGDRPRNVKITFRALDLGLVLEQENRTWTTSGAAAWAPVLFGAHDGVDAARCESPDTGYSESFLSASFTGPGDLSFWWKADSDADYSCGIDFIVDGDTVAYLEDVDTWRQVTVSLDAGTHTVEWVAWSIGTSVAWLDEVTFSGAEATETSTTPEPVPYSWLDQNAASLLAAHGGDYEAAGNAMAANGVNKVWQCYVAGIDPEDEDAKFEATIEMGADGKPVVKWNPPLSEEEAAKRTYRTLGKKTLDPNEEWIDVTDVDDPDAAGWRFFKVKVKMK